MFPSIRGFGTRVTRMRLRGMWLRPKRDNTNPSLRLQTTSFSKRYSENSIGRAQEETDRVSLLRLIPSLFFHPSSSFSLPFLLCFFCRFLLLSYILVTFSLLLLLLLSRLVLVLGLRLHQALALMAQASLTSSKRSNPQRILLRPLLVPRLSQTPALLHSFLRLHVNTPYAILFSSSSLEQVRLPYSSRVVSVALPLVASPPPPSSAPIAAMPVVSPSAPAASKPAAYFAAPVLPPSPVWTAGASPAGAGSGRQQPATIITTSGSGRQLAALPVCRSFT